VSLFRVAKYSALLFFLKRHRNKVHRSVSLLLLGLVTYFLLGDLQGFLQEVHPDSVVYLLVAKSVLLYGGVAILIWMLRPTEGDKKPPIQSAQKTQAAGESDNPDTGSRLDQFRNLERHDKLQTRYQKTLKKR
jgi:hypothetical protein